MQPILDIQNNVAPLALQERMWALFLEPHWKYGSHTDPQSPGIPFWHMDLTGLTPADEFWQLHQAACEKRVGHGLRVVRQYANGHTFGQGGRPHVDDRREGCFTLLYYPMLQWQHEWDGETVFFNADGEIVQAVHPRPNRAVLLTPASSTQAAHPRAVAPTLRVTVAYKLERA